jgi:hypothetical protein
VETVKFIEADIYACKMSNAFFPARLGKRTRIHTLVRENEVDAVLVGYKENEYLIFSFDTGCLKEIKKSPEVRIIFAEHQNVYACYVQRLEVSKDMGVVFTSCPKQIFRYGSRKDRRVPCKIRGRIDYGGKSYEGTLDDISPSGFLFHISKIGSRQKDEIELESRAKIDFSYFGEHLPLECEIRNKRVTGKDLLLGCEFVYEDEYSPIKINTVVEFLESTISN